MDKDFAIEKYKVNFDYLKHIEEIRIKQTHIYLAVVSTLLGIISFLLSNEDVSKVNMIVRFMPFILFVGIVLSTYGAVMTVFFCMQKRNYDYYVSHNKLIEDFFNYPEFKGVSRKKNSISKIIKSAYIYWYLQPSILSIVPIGSVIVLKKVFKIKVFNNVFLDTILELFPIILFAVLVGIYVLVTLKNHKK